MGDFAEIPVAVSEGAFDGFHDLRLRRRAVGEVVTFVRNRNINYTNVCTFKCRFCGFSKGPRSLNLRGTPYLLTLDRFDAKVFEGTVDDVAEFRSDLREIHRLKRQVTLCKRLLWRTVDVTQRMVPNAGKAAALLRDVQENAESYHFYADELLDDANTLLNVQLALASQRTSEVMRVLTVFSVFFLPLTFIVGVYGMNFMYMPELRQRWGYPAVLLAMGVVTFAIHRWFRVRGWLRR